MKILINLLNSMKKQSQINQIKKIQLNCFDKDGTLRKTLLSHIVLETPNEQYNGIIGLLNYVD